MVGACGGVGCTVALGIAALRKGLCDTIGMVSALPVFDSVDLVDPGSLVVGGHEVRCATFVDGVNDLRERSRLFGTELIRRCAPTLRSMQRNIRPGTLCGASASIEAMADRRMAKTDASAAAAVERLGHDLTAFRRGHRLDRVIVTYLGSSEPPVRKVAAHARYATLRKAMAKRGASVLPPSSLYALAAAETGCTYINFTPSPGVSIPAVAERAVQRGIAYMGNDGKTGETLVKSILAPMFAMRHLHVHSWIGQNILGNRDGAVLRDPRIRASKIRSKDHIIAEILGYQPATHVGIDYVPSLDDLKVAWNFIHFSGFLGTKMNMQITWQGSDSALAAPLVIDLARFSALACGSGEAGPMTHLACFFKDPIGAVEHDYHGQWRRLIGHVVDQDGA